MFARHTHSRMKGSGVVFGLKSFLDKIHPQLPLTTKESQRLLTALTSSFRKHLDEAHPTAAQDERKPRLATDAVAKAQVRTWHSSASYADKHLASVLTNPLLAKSGKRRDYTAAKVELAKDPSKDPIELLEEYQHHHAATVPIAQLCLEHFMDRLKVLQPEKKQELIDKYEPGRRVLLWLLQSGFDDSSSYVDNLNFMDLMVYFLVQEGREQNIWDWMMIDVQLASSAPMTAPGRSPEKHGLDAYRWRGRLLHALIAAKLGQRHSRDGQAIATDKVHDALDAYLKACEIKRSAAPRHHHCYWVPLAAAHVRLVKELYRDYYKTKDDLDVNRLDQFISNVPLAFIGAPKTYVNVELAQLSLIHPTRSTATPAYNLLQDLFGDTPSADAVSFLPRTRKPTTSIETHKWHLFMAATISRLKLEGRDQEASWAESIARRELPSVAHFLRRDIEYSTKAQLGRQDRESGEVEEEHSRVPFPLFV